MTSKCPACGLGVEIAFSHQGVASNGYQRGVIEATHVEPPCAGWIATEHDLVALVSAAT